jgi:hypothetical protein
MVIGVLGIVAGVALLVASAAAWSGRWRSWARRFPIGVLGAPLGVFPAAGATLLVGGLAATGAISETSPLAFLAAVVVIAGMVLSLWSPPWFGPRWYREDPKQLAPDLTDPATAAAWGAMHPAPAAPATSLDGHEPLEVLSATWFPGDQATGAMPAFDRGTGVGGKLELHREGLVFRAGKWDARLRQSAAVVEVPSAMIRGAHVEAGKLVVDTGSEPMTFKVFGARSKAAKIQELHGV